MSTAASNETVSPKRRYEMVSRGCFILLTVLLCFGVVNHTCTEGTLTTTLVLCAVAAMTTEPTLKTVIFIRR